MRSVVLMASIVLASLLGVAPSHADKRVALVVGNDHYANLPAVQQLRNAVNDARAVGDGLTRLGFDVIRGENLGRQALVDKLDELTQRLAPGDTAFFFFSGHGVSIGGGNFILPADVPNVDEGQETRLARAALGEHDIVTDLQGRGVRVAIVVLDACRNNPFNHPGGRAIGNERGFVRSDPVRGVFSLYSAGMGQTALDRLDDKDTNPNSVFTRVLLPALTKPGIDLSGLAFEVREEVARLANTATPPHDQRPAYYDETIGGRVYLAGLPAGNDVRPTPPQGPAIDPAAQAWAAVKDTTSIPALEAFIRRYPDGFYVDLARVRIEELKPASGVPAQPHGPGGLPKGDSEAARLYKLAAEYKLAADQGNASAQAKLGVFYRDGLGGLPKDDREAARLFKLAADQGNGNPGAQVNLGVFYAQGRGGLPKDDREAARLYKLAADQGNAQAQSNLGTFYREGRGGLLKDDREAARLYRLAADQGTANAQTNLGFFYEQGRGGLLKDDREAARLYKLAADQGNAQARSNLGTFYREGRGGLLKDDREAARLYRLAADQGNANAQTNLKRLGR
jgi:TPR repeat protein